MKLLDDADIGMIFKNTLLYVVISVLGQFLLGLTLAMALNKPFREEAFTVGGISPLGILRICNRLDLPLVF